MIRKDWKFRTGMVLVIVSIILFLVIPLIPFLSIEKKTKITLSTIILVTAEVLFYSGGFLLGKDLFRKYKSYLNPKNWFRKKVTNPQKITEGDRNE